MQPFPAEQRRYIRCVFLSANRVELHCRNNSVAGFIQHFAVLKETSSSSVPDISWARHSELALWHTKGILVNAAVGNTG